MGRLAGLLAAIFMWTAMLLGGAVASAAPVVEPGTPGYDCRSMGDRVCEDTGTQGGVWRTPGRYDEWGFWLAPVSAVERIPVPGTGTSAVGDARRDVNRFWTGRRAGEVVSGYREQRVPV